MEKKNYLIILLFIVFLFLRLFVNYSDTFMSSDDIKYLHLANHFPYHLLYNNQMFFDHPPFYPYVIHFATQIIGVDYLAAILISLLAACITYFIFYKMIMLLTNDFSIAFTTLIFFTLSVEFITYSQATLKESFMTMIISLAIYFYLKGIKLSSKKSLIASSVFGGLSAITSDHSIFLFPIFILSYLFFRNKKIKIIYVMLPIIITGIFFGSWILVKSYQYSTNEYYPAGLDGAPISTKNFGLMQLLNPRYFKDYEPILGTGFDTRLRDYAFLFGYMFNLVVFYIPRGLNLTTMKYLLFPKHVAYMIIIYLPLAIITLYSVLSIILNYIKKKKIHNNDSLYSLCIFLILIFPYTQKATSVRYGILAYIFLFYFIAIGIVAIFKKLKLLRVYNKIIFAAVILLLLFLPFWYSSNNHFVLFNKKNIAVQNTAKFVSESIGKESGIMGQPGYVIPLIYLTGHRVLGLPIKSGDLLTLIKYYNVSYVVYGRYFTWDNYHYDVEVVEFIRSHPEKFKLITTVPESYKTEPVLTDEVYIYKVVS